MANMSAALKQDLDNIKDKKALSSGSAVWYGDSLKADYLAGCMVTLASSFNELSMSTQEFADQFWFISKRSCEWCDEKVYPVKDEIYSKGHCSSCGGWF